MKPLIRIAGEGDLPAILGIYRRYIESTTVTFEYTTPTSEQFTHRFREITERYPWLVATVGGRVVGYAYADLPFSSRAAYAWDADLSVYLADGAQRQGIGSGLYDSLERLLTLLGYRNVYAIVSGENGSSIAFHERRGFRTVGTMLNSGFKLGRWVDIVWFEKALTQDTLPPTQTPKPISELSDSEFSELCRRCGISKTASL